MSERVNLFVIFFVAVVLSATFLAAGIWYTKWWLIGIGVLWSICTSVVWFLYWGIEEKLKDGDLDYYDTI